MNYYAVQVKTRSELKFIQLYKAACKTSRPENMLNVHFPQRQLDIRKNGRVKPSKMAVFPGYIFLEAKDDYEIKTCQWDFRRIEGFQRFLPSNLKISPLSNRDLELVLHFISHANPVIGRSKVYFNEDSRIVVIEGPLSGLEGRIVKVDRRKGRVKIKLDIYDDSFMIDLAFEVIQPKEI
ncbi:MAG: antiterminator LoaP [Treponema sp.]|nr:antiterminator LoaP [Treponema sp.]